MLTKYILWCVEAYTFVQYFSEHINYNQCRYYINTTVYMILPCPTCVHIILWVVTVYWGRHSAESNLVSAGLLKEGGGWGVKVAVKACDASMLL